MAIPIQSPTFAELLAAYTNNGVANGINQASTNFNNTARTASDVQAKEQAAATAKQQADTAEMLRQSQIVSPDDVTAAISGKAPTHPVNQTFADTILKAKQASDLKEAQIQSQQFEAEQNRLARQTVADQANVVHKDAIASTAQTARSGQFEAAGKNLEGLHWYDKLFNTEANKGVKSGYDFAAKQVGAPSMSGAPAGMTKIQASDGSMHFVPDVAAAQKIDPNLKVIQ